MRVLIVDDEDLARDRILRILSEFEEHQVVGQATNGHEPMSASRSSHKKSDAMRAAAGHHHHHSAYG